MGRRLRDGRGGLLARHPPRRAHDRARGRDPSRSSPPTCTGLRSSTRRAASTTKRPSPTCLPSASSATSRVARAAIEVVPDLRQRIVFARAQRHQGSAVHAGGPRQLPQHAHLPQGAGAAEGARPIPLRAQPWRRRLPRSEREPGRPRERLRGGRSALAHLPEGHRRSVDIDARLPSLPAGVGAGGAAKNGRVRPRAPVSRYSVAQLLGTYDALLEKYMPPSLLLSDRGELVHSFGGASRFLRMRDGRQGLDVLDVVEPELRTLLRGALQRALNGPSPLADQGRARRAGRRASSATCDRAGARCPASRACSSRSRARRRCAPPRTAHQEIDLDEVSRGPGGTPGGRAHGHQREPAGGDRAAPGEQRGAAGLERRAPVSRTRSSRARTKSSRASTRSSTR